MTSDLVETVARAIAEIYYRGPVDDEYMQTACSGSQWFYDTARASIAAVLDDMAEPSDAMVKTFIDAALTTSLGEDCKWPDYARQQWQAMLAQYRKEMSPAPPQEPLP